MIALQKGGPMVPKPTDTKPCPKCDGIMRWKLHQPLEGGEAFTAWVCEKCGHLDPTGS